MSSQWLDVRRSDLEEAALEYARMKCFGYYIDNQGCRVSMGSRDTDSKTLEYRDNLLRCAELLLQELTNTDLPPRK